MKARAAGIVHQNMLKFISVFITFWGLAVDVIASISAELLSSSFHFKGYAS